jgi:hypothetical protein
LLYDPTDLRGLPHFNQETKTTSWFSPDWLPKTGQGVIFFDEINLAPQSMQGACYSLTLDRKIGEYKLPKDYSIIMAGNRLEDSNNIFDMPKALRNRLIHCELKTDTDGWIDWASQNEIDHRIIGFVSTRRDVLAKDHENDMAFARPRTFAFTSDLIKGVKDQKRVEMLASTAIGEGLGIELSAFIKMQNKFNPKEIIENPDKATIPTQTDELCAMITAVADYYNEHPKLFENTLKVVEKLKPEFGILLLRMCRALQGDKFINKLFNSNGWDRISPQYAKYLYNGEHR